MLPQIIEIKDNTPTVSHRVVAEHCNLDHHTVSRIIRKHAADFEEFGHLGFEIQTVQNTVGAINEAKTYHLNEQQATLLFTYMQNTEIVRKFKITLVKAFFELRNNQALVAKSDNGLLLIQNQKIARLTTENNGLRNELLDAYRLKLRHNSASSHSPSAVFNSKHKESVIANAIDALKKFGELNQEQLMAFCGKTKGAIGTRRILQQQIGVFWTVRRGNFNSVLYKLMEGAV